MLMFLFFCFPQQRFHSKLTNDLMIFFLNKDTELMIEKISKAYGHHTIAANVVFHTTGIMFSNDNIAYLSGLCNDLEKMLKSKNKIPEKKCLII